MSESRSVDQVINDKIGLGADIYRSILRNGNRELRVTPDTSTGSKVVVNENTGQVKVGYITIENVIAHPKGIEDSAVLNWSRIRGGPGVTVMPTLVRDGEEHVVMIYKPHPAVGKWLLELPSGAVNLKTEDYRRAALRELSEETGFGAGYLQFFSTNYHAPFRIGWLDRVYVARDAAPMLGHAPKGDYEEKPISTVILNIRQLEDLLWNNGLNYSTSKATIAQYIMYKKEGKLQDYLDLMREEERKLDEIATPYAG
ncbi:MAG: NUDIX hydrolase [Candidatus Micrarchaeota archaeon]|nr:NUDIX hydrolase [Candidatus Micrarchaeota archaeon]